MTQRLESPPPQPAEAASATLADCVPERALPCPLCTYDLRGTTEPRCPECGFPFSREELLTFGDRVHPYLFEHHPERNTVSFFQTLLGGLRPKRFWSTLNPIHPVRRRRLLAYFLLTIGCMGLTTNSVGFGAAMLQDVRATRILRQQLRNRMSGPNPPIDLVLQSSRYSALDEFLDAIAPRPGSWKFMVHVVKGQSFQNLAMPTVKFGLIVATWPLLTLLALNIFRWSMRRARIRTVHVARCVVYSADVFLWIGLAAAAMSPLVSIADRRGLTQGSLSSAGVGLLLIGLFVFARRLTCAYRRYLRFDHPFWTVIASQAIVAMLMVNFFSILTVLKYLP